MWIHLFVSKVKKAIPMDVPLKLYPFLKNVSHVFIFVLIHLGVPGVLENILDHLDHKSLRNTHQVCRQWNETIKRGLSWRRQLQRKVSLP